LAQAPLHRHRGGEVGGDGGFEAHFGAGARVAEGEFPGVEHLAGIIAGAFPAVQFVAEDRMTEVMQVDADLVGPAAVQGAFDEADPVAGTQDAVFGFRGAALAAGDAHPLSMDGMTFDRFIDDAGSLAQRAGDERQINLGHGACGELAGEVAVGRVVLRDDEGAAGFFVETVNNPRAFFPPDAGKIAAIGEQRVHQRVLLMPGARVHDDSGRLVQDEEIVVLENHIERDLFRERVDLLDFRFAQFHGVAGADEVAGPRDFPVHGHEAVADEGLEPGAGEGGERLGEDAVEALAGVFAFDDELAHG
jgi:hypothetical protein